MRRTLITAVLGLLMATPLAAQQGGWELGGFGRYTRYDDSFNQVDSTKTENSWGLGGRIGYFVAPRWSFELDGSGNPTDINRTTAQSVGLVYMPFHLRAIYNAPIGERASWLLGAGPNYNRYRVSDAADAFTSKTFEGDDWGIGGLTGFRVMVTDWLSARVDGTIDYIPSPQNDPNGSNTMLGAQAGLGIHLGGKCTDRLDSIRVEPRNPSVNVGETVNFRATGFLCDGSTTDVTPGTTAALTAGTATLTGMAFSANQPGSYSIRFNNQAAAKRKTDNVTVTVVQPPPPAPTLTRVDLQPDNATVFGGEAVPLRVMGFWSDGTSRELTNCQLTPDGGTIANGAFSSRVAGTYTVTATCEGGRTDRSTITVRTVDVTLRALFRFNRTNVYVRAELDSLRALARLMNENPTLQLTLYGHTDSVGSDAYNCNLGWRRIQAVADSLRSFGAPADRITAAMKTSYGERQPVATNNTDAGRAQNRRVEIYDRGSAKEYTGQACPAPRR